MSTTKMSTQWVFFFEELSIQRGERLARDMGLWAMGGGKKVLWALLSLIRLGTAQNFLKKRHRSKKKKKNSFDKASSPAASSTTPTPATEPPLPISLQNTQSPCPPAPPIVSVSPSPSHPLPTTRRHRRALGGGSGELRTVGQSADSIRR